MEELKPLTLLKMVTLVVKGLNMSSQHLPADDTKMNRQIILYGISIFVSKIKWKFKDKTVITTVNFVFR